MGGSAAEVKVKTRSFQGEMIMAKRPEWTGFPAPHEEHGDEAPPAPSRPLAEAWITKELIAENRRVWSRAYGRTISEPEAVEIIMNLHRFAEAVLRAKRERMVEQ
jgi:hypothetical protein